jgi:RNA polymerase sigma-70 factor, ECF subfamily
MDEHMLARLYDEYAGDLYRYAVVVLADATLAEDAVQQVFAKLLASEATLEAPERYLRRAVRNECYSLLARRGDAGSSPLADRRPLLEPSDDARRSAMDGADRLAIEAALRELPAEQREVVVLKIYEGRTLKEIAEQTGVPLNTAASRYRYALDKLRAMLTTPVRQE